MDDRNDSVILLYIRILLECTDLVECQHTKASWMHITLKIKRHYFKISYVLIKSLFPPFPKHIQIRPINDINKHGLFCEHPIWGMCLWCLTMYVKLLNDIVSMHNICWLNYMRFVYLLLIENNIKMDRCGKNRQKKNTSLLDKKKIQRKTVIWDIIGLLINVI